MAVAALRLYFCAQVPANTGDAPRHILYGLYVLRDGLATAGAPLVQLDPALAGVSWAQSPYNYPPVALAFFTLLAAVSPTVFAMKVALTAIEGVNAWLVSRVTESRWLGVLYWASPISIWSVSREGQFEPLQALFMLAAIALLRRSAPAAFALLALAVQVKVTAILLLPWFLLRLVRDAPAQTPLAVAAFAAGFLPSVVVAVEYPFWEGIRSLLGTLHYNPYYWNVLERERFLWNPGWLIASNAVATLGAIGFLAWRAVRSVDPTAYAGAIAFLVFLKASALGQFWYVLLFPAFVAPIPERRVRFWLIALTPLLDVYSTLQVIVGPFGYTMGDYWSQLTVFTELGIR